MLKGRKKMNKFKSERVLKNQEKILHPRIKLKTSFFGYNNL